MYIFSNLFNFYQKKQGPSTDSNRFYYIKSIACYQLH